jgi:hypothetical protein
LYKYSCTPSFINKIFPSFTHFIILSNALASISGDKDMTTYGALARTNVTTMNAYVLGSGVVVANTPNSGSETAIDNGVNNRYYKIE